MQVKTSDTTHNKTIPVIPLTLVLDSNNNANRQLYIGAKCVEATKIAESKARVLTWGAFLAQHNSRNFGVGPRPLPAAGKVILAIGAHPDDIEFGCGAALFRFRQQGYAIHGLVVSDGVNGGPQRPEILRDVRLREAIGGGRAIGLETLIALAMPDCGLFARRTEVREGIEAAIDALKPDIVLTHTPVDLHLDHQLVFEATNEAARSVPSLLCYENPNTPPSFRPTLFVDVTAHLYRKIHALQCHVSQAGKPYFSREVIRSIARMRGNQAKVRYAEGFEAVRLRIEAI